MLVISRTFVAIALAAMPFAHASTPSSSVTLVVPVTFKSASDDRSFPGCPRLSENNSTGDCVTTLQNDLEAMGYSLGPTGADGNFGSYTRKAVIAFQSDARSGSGSQLGADGIVGPETNGLALSRSGLRHAGLVAGWVDLLPG